MNLWSLHSRFKLNATDARRLAAEPREQDTRDYLNRLADLCDNAARELRQRIAEMPNHEKGNEQ